MQLPAQAVDKVQNDVRISLDHAFHHELPGIIPDRNRNTFFVHILTDIFGVSHKRAGLRQAPKPYSKGAPFLYCVGELSAIISIIFMAQNFRRKFGLAATVAILLAGGIVLIGGKKDRDARKIESLRLKQLELVQADSRPNPKETNADSSISYASDRGTGGTTSQDSMPREELTRNGGFEEGGSPVPIGWMRDSSRTGAKGTVSQDQTQAHSGHASLKLEPNQKNGGDFPLAVAQVIPAGQWAGKKVEFSAYVSAEEGATAVLGVLNFVRGKPANLVTVTQPSGTPGWVRKSHLYDVPNDPTVQLVVTCFVTGTSGTAWFDDVSVMLYAPPGEGTAPAVSSSGAPSPPVAETTLQASVEVDAEKVIRQIPPTLYGANVEWIWNGNFLWQEQTKQSNPEALRLTRDLGVSLIRFPGGHFSDFYHWKDGIGPFEKRPEALHEKGKNDRSRPNFGTDEALDFAQRTNSELLITVNAGSGSAQEAADWVGYINGKTDRVRYWEVGNELYMNEGSAMSKSVTVNPSSYASRFREFAQAMRAVDPRIQVGAIGGENQGRYASVTYSNWNRTVLEKAGDQMDFLAIHNAYAPVLLTGDDRDVRTVYRAMLAAPVLIKRNLETVEQQIATYAPSRASHIGIAVTEWGPLFEFDPRGRYVDHAKTLGSALFVASALKTFIESPRTEIANFFLLNDLSVLGFIGSRNGQFPPVPEWAPTARYFAFQLYTQHFGEQLVSSKTESPTFDSETIGLIDAVKGVPYLDVVSSLSADGRKLFIMAVNKHFDNTIEATISLRGFQPIAKGTAWTLTGTSIDANTGTTPLRVPGLNWGRQTEDEQNPRFSRGTPAEVTLSSADVPGLKAQFNYRFPPHSVTSLVLTRAK
jgi:alpha-L-arabinofuranosidase